MSGNGELELSYQTSREPGGSLDQILAMGWPCFTDRSKNASTRDIRMQTGAVFRLHTQCMARWRLNRSVIKSPVSVDSDYL